PGEPRAPGQVQENGSQLPPCSIRRVVLHLREHREVAKAECGGDVSAYVTTRARQPSKLDVSLRVEGVEPCDDVWAVEQEVPAYARNRHPVFRFAPIRADHSVEVDDQHGSWTHRHLQR